MKFTIGDGDKFGVPEGQYPAAKFLGVSPMKEPQGGPLKGKDGKPMEPGLAWEFEVTEGDHRGKIVGRVTGKFPTAKNACGRMMAAVSGRYLKPGVEIDLDQYVGKLYTITVEPKEFGEGTRVSFTPAPVAYTGAAAPAPSGPPPRRGVTNSGKPAPAFYWVETNPDADPIRVDDLRKFFTDNESKHDARTTLVCPDGGSEYKPAVEFDSGLLF